MRSEDALRWDEEVDELTTLPIRVLQPLQWRPGDREGRIGFHDAKKDVWKDLNVRYRPVIEGLQQGERMPALRDRLQAAHPDWAPPKTEYILRYFLAWLMRRGYIDVETPAPPAMLDGRYEVVRQLGRGGMGVVWLARDREQRGRPRVAIKHAWNWRGGFAKRDAALRQEAEAMAAVDHPHVVKLLRTFEHEGRFHVVRQFLDGRPLSARLRQSRASPEARLRYAYQMAETLVALRDAGFLYTDFKPGNFFVLKGDRSLVLGDLGMCRPLSPGATSVRGLIGTDAYAPPEVYRERCVSETALVFSFGRAYWQLVTGKAPKSTSTVEKLVERRAVDLPALKERGASDDEVALVEACWRVDPKDRPQTFEDVRRLIPRSAADA